VGQRVGDEFRGQQHRCIGDGTGTKDARDELACVAGLLGLSGEHAPFRLGNLAGGGEQVGEHRSGYGRAVRGPVCLWAPADGGGV